MLLFLVRLGMCFFVLFFGMVLFLFYGVVLFVFLMFISKFFMVNLIVDGGKGGFDRFYLFYFSLF